MMQQFNQTQRIGIFLAVVAVVALVFMHNPFDGYTTSTSYMSSGNSGSPECVALSKKSVYDMTAEELGTKCSPEEVIQPIPFFSWYANAPHVAWLGSIGHLFVSFIAVVVIGGAWVLIFGAPTKSSSSQ